MVKFAAKLISVIKHTHDIHEFEFECESKEFTFKPGQWIDFKVPSIERLGGYSLTSSPSQLPKFSLAIRNSSKHPVTQYMIEQARPGECFEISNGSGRVFYNPNEAVKNLVLVAGGIGITPIISIFRAAANASQQLNLVHIVKNESELIFANQIQSLAANHKNIDYKFIVTAAKNSPYFGNRSDLQNHITKFAADTSYYLCGPPKMIDECEARLIESGHPKQNLRFEKWW